MRNPKIRVKVKHLVTGLAAAALLIGFGYKAMPVIADLAGVDRPIWDGEAGKWKNIQDNVLRDGSDSLAHAFQVYVGPDSTFTSGDVNAKSPMAWEEKLPLLISYVNEGPATGDYLALAAKQLALYYAMAGETDRAIQALETAEGRIDAYQTGQLSQLRLERAALLVRQGDYDQATALLDGIDKLNERNIDTERSQRIAELRAQMLIEQGETGKALDIVKQGIAAIGKQQQTIDALSSDKTSRAGSESPGRLDTLSRSLDERSAGDAGAAMSAVSGTVARSDGKPMAHVGVFLRTKDDVNHSLLETEPYQTMTDDQGRYSFADVLPGAYQLTLGFNYDQIDGWVWPINNYEWIDVRRGEDVAYPVVLKPLMSLVAPVNNAALTGDGVAFEWQPVSGAAYYKLTGYIEFKEKNGSSTMGVVVHDRIQSHALDIPREELYNTSSGYLYHTVNGETVPEPASLLAFANPGQRFSWSVAAYDSAGEELTQSNGYRLSKQTMGALPYFTLKGRTLTEGDRLLLDGRTDDAIAVYKQAWEANRADAYSLGKLIKLLEVRRPDRGDSSGASDAQDQKELLAYELQMLALQPRLADCYWLLNYSIGQRDWENARHYYELAQGLAREDSIGYVKAAYASALMTQGKISQARLLYAESVPQDNIHSDIGEYIAADLYVTGELTSALALSEAYPERQIGEDAVTDWQALVQDMIREQAGSAGYVKTLQNVMHWQLAHRQTDLGHWDEAEKHPAMVRFLEALAR